MRCCMNRRGWTAECRHVRADVVNIRIPRFPVAQSLQPTWNAVVRQ